MSEEKRKDSFGAKDIPALSIGGSSMKNIFLGKSNKSSKDRLSVPTTGDSSQSPTSPHPPLSPNSTPLPSPLATAAGSNGSLSSIDSALSPRKQGSPEAVQKASFWHAINEGSIETVATILDENPTWVNLRDENSFTPLHVACKGGSARISLCDLLLNRGADVTIETVNGTSPMHYLVGNITKESDPKLNGLLEKFMMFGADVNRRSTQGESMLHYACSGKTTRQVIEFILNHGADVNLADTRGYTPLHLAILQKKPQIVKLLLNKGASLTAFSKQGSCIELAKKEENILEALWTAGFGEFLNPKKRRNQNPDQSEGFERLETFIQSTDQYLNKLQTALRDINKTLSAESPSQEAWNDLKNNAKISMDLLHLLSEHSEETRKSTKNFISQSQNQRSMTRSGMLKSEELNEFTHLASFEICENYHYNNYGLLSSDPIEYTTPFSEVWSYRTYFADKEHQNLIGTHKNLGTVIVSIMKTDDDSHYRFIVRSQFGDVRLLIPVTKLEVDGRKLSSYQLLVACNPILNNIPFRLIETPMTQPLLQFESSMISNQMKFGVLLAHDGQTQESEMFANDSHPLFDEFLALLGDKVKLEGFSNYAGGLDTKNNLTGTHSVYTQHHGWEIMFHVSTLLPKSTVDEQQIERKKHLGNDICLLVFNTGKTKYNPKMIRTQFIHIIVVVQVAELNPDGTASKYRIEVAYNSVTPPFQPLLRSPPIYDKNERVREVVLAKLINGELSARLDNNGFFGLKMRKPRLQLLEEIAKKF